MGHGLVISELPVIRPLSMFGSRLSIFYVTSAVEVEAEIGENSRPPGPASQSGSSDNCGTLVVPIPSDF